MRTLYFLIGGVALYVLLAFLAKAIKLNAFMVFAGIWFMVAAVNMYIGVAQAGYSFMEELPIFLLIFIVPVAIAYFLKRRIA